MISFEEKASRHGKTPEDGLVWDALEMVMGGFFVDGIFWLIHGFWGAYNYCMHLYMYICIILMHSYSYNEEN